MHQLGLIGYPLTHSFSPSYFAKKFEKEGIVDWNYKAFPIADIKLFKELWTNNKDLIGLNVTIPYKQLVIPYLDRLDEAAAAIGAVNTIKKEGDKLVGYNTDVYGFESTVLKLLGDKNVENALILGTGGASKAVEYVLEKLGINYQLVSRTKKKGRLIYDEIDEQILSNHQLIINTTPLGTYPNTKNCPSLNYNDMNEDHYLLDLVYNPPESLFLKQGRIQGAKTINGLLMLHQQAEKAWQIWNEKLEDK